MLALILLLIVRAIYVIRGIRSEKPDLARRDPVKTLVVLGSGGHTTEMIQLLQQLKHESYTPLVFVVADTDITSMRRVEAFGARQPDSIYRIPRSREVGQSYLSSIVTTLWSFLHAFGIVLRIRPNVLLCNGPGTCLPIAIVTLAYRILGLCEGRIIFVESFCRVQSLSLTGKLLYHVVDLFVVHWESLQTKFPRSKVVSTFVPHRKT
ncbi:unnamed protein product [Cylindrotheca closterium]|uniref:UDP-N-acetylglucosamine transferase subunit ALG14 n=1 Tax=Cylindrotheca closterium TaxID=2856 RepID=A0AAD2CU27_9STRA|nr:unnamed protein product [Cylindrotheca closterium]